MAPKLELNLPVTITSQIEIGRLLRELETLNEALLQLGIRNDGEVKLPKTTRLMDQLVDLNKINLLHPEERQQLHDFLIAVKDRAPLLHISFSADPSAAFLEKLVAWLRREIDPHVLVTIGLQPSLGAGCIVRTTNRYFDFSLKEDFASKRELLRSKLLPQEVQS